MGAHAEALADLLPVGKPAAPSSGLPSAAALVSDEDAPASKMLGSYTAEDARRAVLAAPPLRCLGTATMWADVFEPSVGDLAAFLQSQPDLHVLEVDGGSFVRLLHGGIEEFKQAAARLDAVATAALAVSLCVNAGSAALAPLALLGGFVQRALAGARH